MTQTSHPHSEAAFGYAEDVVAGRVVACKWVRLRCQYQLDLYESWLADEREDIRYNYDEAERVCKFIQRLPHVKGRWARDGRDIELEPWQQFILAQTFGWQVWDEEADGWVRLYRTVYVSVARKNTKTTMCSGVGLFGGFAEEEAGAEVYSAATGRDQARIAFDIANQMVRKSPDLQSRFDIRSQAHNIYSIETGSKFEALSSDVKGLDGKNPHVAIIDEFHAHKNNEVLDAMETGMGSREQPLLWIITTAGSNLGGPCFQMEHYVQRVLEGVVVDERVFGIIYTLDQPESLDGGDKGDEWTDPACWIKANPNLGVSVFQADLESRCKQAQEDPIKQSAFLTKRLNIWVAADIRWMNLSTWNVCGEAFDVGQFKGVPCWMGVDLASRDDICAIALVWRRDGHLYTSLRYFLPRGTLLEQARLVHKNYEAWAATGKLELTPGDIIDFNYIEAEILAMAKTFQVEEIAYDPWRATQLATNLESKGATVVEIAPTIKNFSEPMKEMGSLVNRGMFHHGGDPVLTWMVSNVVAHRDKTDNIKPNKERPENKIDGVVAILMAMSRMMRHQEPQPSRYEDPDAEVLVI